MRRPGNRSGKSARIIPRRDRPGIAGGIERRLDPHRPRVEPERPRHDLGDDRAVPLTLRQRVDHRRHPAERIERDRRHRLRPAFRPGGAALVGGQRRRDIAHIRDRRLDHRRIANPVKPPLAPRGLPPPPQFGELALVDRAIDRAAIIAGIKHRPRRAAMREAVDEVAPDHLERVEAERLGDPRDEAFQGEIDLRPAKPAHQPARRLVRHDDAVADLEVRDPVSAGHVAVHAIERRRLGRAQIGAAILDLVPIERGDPPIRLDRGR